MMNLIATAAAALVVVALGGAGLAFFGEIAWAELADLGHKAN